MLWRTHVLAGATAGLLVAGKTSDLKTAAISATIAGFAALLADIDDPNSKIGRMVPILPRVLNITAGHRGITHSILVAIIISAILSAFAISGYNLTYRGLFLLILIGYASHLLPLDVISNSGCYLFYPLKIRVCLPLVNTGGIIEKFIVFPLTGIVFIWAAWPYICMIADMFKLSAIIGFISKML